MKRIICIVLSMAALWNTGVFAQVQTDAKSVILMEASTGKVLYEDNADEQLPIASVTKIMTMLLIAEAIDLGKITADDMVSVSENAMSYGGSTMFLEAGEQLSVSDMLKGIAVASANDGAVAMAEFLEGSESAFVDKMNKRAKELGMENTNFMNTNGLDEEGHYSSARDVAIMSRELISHPLIFDYTTIWIDQLRDGKFQLANTNKLIRFYNGANGLKTGSTSQALCCLSATAKRDNMQLIAVVLGAPTSAKRFDSAKALLDYGFAGYKIENVLDSEEIMGETEVKLGLADKVEYRAEKSYPILREKGDGEECTPEISVDECVYAPIKAGDKVGSARVVYNGEEEEIELVAVSDVEAKSLKLILADMVKIFLGNFC
ncbi:MAG: D-alanyl-D-alanine carboxypeptidase [Clostridiales bacterium]|nr:D-alanyl-D-alanine carboxypeptidase [Clostridiales bacterium]